MVGIKLTGFLTPKFGCRISEAILSFSLLCLLSQEKKKKIICIKLQMPEMHFIKFYQIFNEQFAKCHIFYVILISLIKFNTITKIFLIFFIILAKNRTRIPKQLKESQLCVEDKMETQCKFQKGESYGIHIGCWFTGKIVKINILSPHQ